MTDTGPDRFDHPFADLARSVFPVQTSRRLAAMSGHDQRLCQRWMSGQAEPPQDVIDDLLKQQIALRETEVVAEIRDTLDNAQRNGVHLEALGAALWHAYEQLLGRPPK